MVDLPPPDFRRAFQRGLGRGLSELRNQSDDSSARAIVLDGLIHARTFDPQVEGTRRDYLLQAWKLLGPQVELTELLASELATLQEVDERHWDVTQMIDLLVGLAHRGEMRAAEVLRATYEKHSGKNGTLWELLGDGLIELEGIAGLIRVLRDQARLLLDDPEGWDREFVNRARYVLGDEIVEAALPGILEAEPLVAGYIQAAQALKAERKAARSELQSVKKPRPDAYEEVWQYIRRAISMPYPPRAFPALRLQRFTPVQIRRLAHDLTQTEDVVTLRLLLFVLEKFELSDSLSRLLKLSRHSDSLIAGRAIGALGRLTHPSVRSLALTLMQGMPDGRSDAVRLLVTNLETGDDLTLRQGLESLISEQDEDWLHNYGRELMGLVRESPSPALLSLLAEAFPHQPCTNCRARALEVLIHHEAVPDWLVAEAALDASAKIRQMFANPNP